MEYTIVNGPQHGEKLALTEAVPEGNTVNVMSFPRICRNIVGPDRPIRYSTNTFTRRYHVIGDFAYYLGEEIDIYPDMAEADRVLGPIARNMKTKDAA